MNTAVKLQEIKIKDVNVTDDTITAYFLMDEQLAFRLLGHGRLSEVTPEQRAHYEIIGDGQGIQWPDIDEDISAEGMLYGTSYSTTEEVNSYSIT